MILLIHGAGAGSWEWGIWQRAFAAEGLTTIALHLQPASTGLAHTRYEDYLLQVEHAIAKHQPSVVIGASLGGLLAAEALALNPSDTKLVLLAPAGNRHSGCIPLREKSCSEISTMIKPSGKNVSPFKNVPPNEIKRWANDPQLARTARAVPDADTASVWFAHSRWRDESANVLATAQLGRHFEWRVRWCLMLAAALDTDVSNENLAQWAARDGMLYRLIPDASHAGLLLGDFAAVLAQRVIAAIKLTTLQLKPEFFSRFDRKHHENGSFHRL